MYTDEAGVENKEDVTKFFVVSGAIFHEDNLTEIKKIVQQFKIDTFTKKFEGNEIHIHDIFKGKKDFQGITLVEKEEFLTKIYQMINSLNFSTISVAIDKHVLLSSKFSHYDPLETAYKFLIERFDKYLGKTNNKGIVRIDKTTEKCNALNKKDTKILNLINNIRHNGTNWQSVRNIIESPSFHDSNTMKGLQIADAIAYCTNRILNENDDFCSYWDLLKPKIQCDASGNIHGYGLTIFPK